MVRPAVGGFAALDFFAARRILQAAEPIRAEVSALIKGRGNERGEAHLPLGLLSTRCCSTRRRNCIYSSSRTSPATSRSSWRFLRTLLVWNRGISYGLFQQHSEAGRWFLIVFSLAAAVGLSIWAWRSGERLLSLALGLIAGGAIGNMIDRILYGAVLDFAHLHWGDFSWYVFNIADAAIVAGVGLLLYDSVRSRGGSAPEST